MAIPRLGLAFPKGTARTASEEAAVAGNRYLVCWVLLAGAVGDFALRSGVDAPDWVQRGSLDTFWFVNSSPGLDAYTFARSPVSMQVRGVIIDPADLAAV